MSSTKERGAPPKGPRTYTANWFSIALLPIDSEVIILGMWESVEGRFPAQAGKSCPATTQREPSDIT